MTSTVVAPARPAVLRSGWVEVLAITLLAAVVAATFFHRLLFGSGVYVALDLLGIEIPLRVFLNSVLHAGEFPLWIPGVWMGAPLLANGDVALLYPLQFLFFLMNPARALGWELWLHAALSVFTMYAFGRLSLNLRPAAAFTAGVVFAFNGYALGHTGFVTFVYEAPWIPLMFLSVERGLNGSVAWGWLAPVILAVGLLAGQPQELYFSGVWLTAFAALLVLQRPSLHRALRAGTLLAAAVLGGFGLAAASVLPQAELVSLGARGGAGLSFADAGAFPLPSTFNPWSLLLSPNPFFGENGAWIGATGIALGLAALVRGVRQPEGRLLVAFFTVMAAGCYVLALGPQTPLYRPLVDLLPGMHQFRFPVRWLYPMTVAVACLAGLGAEEVMSLIRPGRRLAPAGLALGLLLAAALVGSRTNHGHALLTAWADRHRLEYASEAGLGIMAITLLAGRSRLLAGPTLAWLVPVGLALELFAAAQFLEWNHPGDGDFYSRIRPIPAYVRAHDPGRVLPAAPGEWLSYPERIDENAGLLAGVDSVLGSFANWPTSRNQAFLDLEARPLYQDQPAAVARSELWRVAGVRYVVVDTVKQPLLAGSPALELVARDREWALYQLRDPVLRVWSSCGARFEASPEQALSSVLASDFRATDLHLEGAGPNRGQPGQCGTARITREHLNSIEASVELPSAGWLVLGDSWYPGWQATVDGRPAGIEHADYFFRAVAIPGGHHQVTFNYAPASSLSGLGISAVAVIAWAVSLVVVLRFRRRMSNI